MSKTIQREIVIPQPREQVWRAITDSTALAEWMFPNDFSPQVTLEQPMNTRALLLPLVLVMTLGVIACDAGDRSAAPRSKSPAEPTTPPTSNMKISLKFQDKTLTATLYDTPTARDFASMLPLTLTLEDYSKTEKISDLPKKLTREGAPAGADPSVGDIAYYAPWGTSRCSTRTSVTRTG